MTAEEKKKNEAIARVAYLIAASDGEVNKDEREVFKKTLQAIQGFDFGEPDTTAFIERVVDDADKLVRLREFYNDEQMIKALMGKAAEDVLIIKDDKLALRKAFAAWISICVADKTFSGFERRIIKGLQAACNGISIATIAGVPLAGIGGLALGAALAGAVGAAIGGGLAAILGKIAVKPEQKFGAESVISDDFLAEIESRCFVIDQLSEQYANSKDESEKEGLQSSIEGLIESFKEFINDVPNK